MEPDIDVLRALAQRKLMQQVNRKNGSLRLMLGHVELLDHFNDYQQNAAAATARQASSQRSTSVSGSLSSPQLEAQLATIVDDVHTALAAANNADNDKDAIMIDCVEIDEELSDDDSLSDEEEVTRLCDALELAPLQKQLKHSPPMFVEDRVAKQDRNHTYATFAECVCEVEDEDG